ncbi:hypothetical protein [Labrenzia sp. THAF35]|uniref:hypothetical protein n=1 Tax=Labrenzia sp. THAF35 TaxID=2587854 RepID=UPI00336AA6C8
MCASVHGEPPTADHHAAHSCGNGKHGCCNPKHLQWKTPSENEQDKIDHGTSNRGERCASSKLTAGDVIWIRSHKGTPTREIAKKFGVSVRTVQDAASGKTWSWLDSAKAA